MSALSIAFILDATEYERGWGQRPDGVVVFASEADADAFIARMYADRTGPAPDEYTNYTKLGYREVKPEVLVSIRESAQGYRWYRNLHEVANVRT